MPEKPSSEPGSTAAEAATWLVVTTTAGLEREARQELRRALPDATAQGLFFKGNLLLATGLPEEEAVARVAAAATECVGSVTPVQRRLAVSADPACFPAVAEAVAATNRLRPGDTFVVRCRRRGEHRWTSRELERAVADAVAKATGAVGEYEVETQWRVTVQVYQDLAYAGVNRPGEVIERTPRRQRKYPPGERPLNRAQWKLREAFTAFGLEAPRGGRALDLGSAPGGWAAVLAEAAAEVVAVDPADLHPDVAALPNVVHLRCRAEDLPGRPEVREPFDLLTSDMNRDPAEVAGVMCAVAPLLRPGGPAIMTIKYTTPDRRRHEREAREALSAEYEAIRMRRLPHNARETTAAMRRRGGADAAPK